MVTNIKAINHEWHITKIIWLQTNPPVSVTKLQHDDKYFLLISGSRSYDGEIGYKSLY